MWKHSWVKVQNFQNLELMKFKFLNLKYAFKIIIFQVYMVNCLYINGKYINNLLQIFIRIMSPLWSKRQVSYYKLREIS